MQTVLNICNTYEELSSFTHEMTCVHNNVSKNTHMIYELTFFARLFLVLLMKTLVAKILNILQPEYGGQ